MEKQKPAFTFDAGFFICKNKLMRIQLKNANVVLPANKAENISILIENEKIAAVSVENKTFDSDRVFDLENTTLCAGFIDIHNHGSNRQ